MKNILFHLFIVSWRFPRNAINRAENGVKFQRRKLLFIGVIIFCLLFWVEIVEIAAKSQHISKDYKDYNIIMVWIDALRADHLSCYGYDRKTSPNINKLAHESIVFKNNFTPHTVTIASFMSIITSLYPASHGVLYVAKDRLSPRIKTLAQILQMYDYTTAWFGPEGCPHLDPKIGYGRGFDTVGNFPENLKKGRIILFDSIENNKNEKFFLNFHTYKVHDPYMPSSKYKDKFTKKKMKEVKETREELLKATFDMIKDGLLQKKGVVWEELGEELASELISKDLFKGDFNARKMQEIFTFLMDKKQFHKWDNMVCEAYKSRIDCDDINIIKHLKDLYDATILEFDTEIIGPLITNLKELNLYDKTMIIICADHGDEFCEHGGLSHGATLYDEVIHVPLIIKFPWIKKGRRIQQLTQTVDIMPTILDLLGIPIPYHAQGKSLVPLIKKKNASPLRKYVFGQLPYLSTIRSKEWKFSVNKNGTKELFHLQSDPGEQRNIYFRKRHIASKLESELKKWEASLPSYKEKSSFLPHIDKATQERIKKTGYW